MAKSLVLTFFGPDQPGIVEHISTVVSDHGGNWLESGMSHLGGKFAGILVITSASDKADSLKAALEGLAAQGLQVSVEFLDSDSEAPTKALSMELLGHDRPGIVRDISSVLKKHHVNVEQLTTELSSGSMSAEPMFKAKLDLQAPEGTDLDALQDDLEEIANNLMVDFNF